MISSRSHARCTVSRGITWSLTVGGTGDDGLEVERERRPGVSADSALWNFSEGCGRGVAVGEEEGENQREVKGATGMVINACMTWVKGGARGFGNVGGRPLNSRSRGGRRLDEI